VPGKEDTTMKKSTARPHTTPGATAPLQFSEPMRQAAALAAVKFLFMNDVEMPPAALSAQDLWIGRELLGNGSDVGAIPLDPLKTLDAIQRLIRAGGHPAPAD